MVSSAPPGLDLAQRWQDELQQMFLRTQKAMELAVDVDDANVGQTPKDVIWRRGRTQLYHYRPLAERTVATPILMVHSLISKPYILDLYPGGSFVEFLLKHGFDVYLIDWGTPEAADRHLVLEDYVQKMIPTVVRRIARDSPTGRVSIFGYCMGGLLTVMYAALHQRAPLDAVACLATPVDFSKMGLFSVWTDERYFDVDAIVERMGNIPAEMMRRSFSMLKPASEFSPVRYISLWQNILNDRYVEQYRSFNKWTNDHIPFPGECFRQVTKELQWGNKLIKDELILGGKPVRLGAIKRPFLHVVAGRDHIVPLDSASPLVEMVGSDDKEQMVLDGGHVGIVAGRTAVKNLWPRVATWLESHSSEWPKGGTS
jgi:polyhydroxyalkanoate synthase